MAMINLDADKIISINNELDSLNKTLISSYTPHLKETIGAIRDNVQNDQIHSILATIDSQVDSITSDISIQLPKLQDFLATQMESYKKTEETALANLDEVVKGMQAFSGMPVQSIRSDAESRTDVQPDVQPQVQPDVQPQPQQQPQQQAQEAPKSSWGKAGEAFGRVFSDIGDAYSDTTGAGSFIFNTLEAGVNVVGDLVEGTIHTGVAAVETVVDIGAWALNGLADAAGWLLSW